MTDKEISSLTAATTPLDGTEIIHVEQSSNSRKVAVSEIAALVTGAMLKSVYDADNNGIIAVAQGGTNAATASAARTNLGLGTMAVQNASSVAITGGTMSGVSVGWSSITTTPTTLSGYGITDAQPLDSDLTAIAAVSTQAYGRGLLAHASEAAFKAGVNLEIGTDVQAYDALLQSIASLTVASGDIIYGSGVNTVSRLPIGSSGQVLKVSGGSLAWGTTAGAGDMLESVYDPTSVGGDAFDQDNMVDGTTNKNYTATEQTKVGHLTVTADVDLDNSILTTTADVSGASFVIDEDDMASDSATKVPTQQSVNQGKLQKVATRTALKALDGSKHLAIYLYEAGREGAFKWNGSDLSTEVTADTQEGIYIAPSSDATGASGAWVRQYSGLADVRWFGAALDNTTDDTDAFNTALAVAEDVLFPEGQAYVTDMVTVPNGGNLIGVDVARSRFSIKSDFNMLALGVVKMGSSENSSLIDEIGFEFEQPATGARVDMNQYPPAINHNNIPRVRIGHIRISAGWDGIDAGGNAGGSKYGFIECGTLNRGLLVDGALDTFDVGYFKVWPWGIGASGDGGTGDVYRDQTNIGAEIGRADGLEGKLILFQTGFLLNANASAGGGTPRHLDAVHLDSAGAWLKCQSGQIDIDYLYFTRNDGANNAAIRVESGIVRIADIHGSSADADTSCLEVAGGTLAVNGGRLRNTGVGARTAYVGAGSGVLKIRNTELASPGTRTQPIIRADGGEIYIQNNEVSTADTGTGDFIQCTVTTVKGKVGDNRLNGRTLNLSTSLIGEVDQSYSGYVSADATTTVRLPAGWTVSKPGTGNYLITHNLAWPQSRQAITITPQNNATDASAVVDQTNTTTNVLRVRTYSAGTAADLPFTFTIAYS